MTGLPDAGDLSSRTVAELVPTLGAELDKGEREGRAAEEGADCRDRPPVADVGPGGIFSTDEGLDSAGGEDPHDL
jgi:hypothetical protein